MQRMMISVVPRWWNELMRKRETPLMWYEASTAFPFSRSANCFSLRTALAMAVVWGGCSLGYSVSRSFFPTRTIGERPTLK